MYSHYIPDIKFHLKLASCIYSTAYVWDESTGTLRVKTGKVFHCLQKVDHVVSAAYAMFQVSQLLGNYLLSEKLLIVFFCILFLLTLALRWDWDLGPKDIPSVNAMLFYDKTMTKDKVKKSTALKLSIATGKLGTITCVVIPLMIFCLVYSSPCIPPFLGSFIIPKMYGDCSSLPVLVKLSFATFEWFIYSRQLYPAVLKAAWFILVGVVYLLENLNTVHLKPKTQNWVKRYKSLQILTGLINTSMGRLSTIFIFSGSTIQLYAAFVCVKFRDEVGWPSFGMFPIILIDSFVALTIFVSAGGKVFGNSKKMIEARSREIVRGKPGKLMKYRLLQLKACPELRVQFAQNNFIEETTPLVIQGFAWSNFVNLLVMHRETVN